MRARRNRAYDNATRIAIIVAALLLVFAVVYAFTGR